MKITATITTKDPTFEERLLDFLEDCVLGTEAAGEGLPPSIEGFTVNVRSWRWTRRAERLGGLLLALGIIALMWALFWMLAPSLPPTH